MTRRGEATGAQIHPDGPLVSLTDEERGVLKKARLDRGWEQKVLADKIGVTPATISNIEGGRSKQVRRGVYVKLLKALKLPPASNPGAALLSETVDLLAGLELDDAQTVRDLAASLANRSKKPA